MPRGTTIPNLPEVLFEATMRVLLRDGPNALTGRSITREAGCATGLLNNHFGSFEAFLAEFVAKSFKKTRELASTILSNAGKGDIVGNLVEASLGVFSPETSAVLNLVRSRPTLRYQIRQAFGPRPIMGALHRIEELFTEYLEAEKRLGRVKKDADSGAIAIALIGTIQHLSTSIDKNETDLKAELRRVINAIISGIVNS